MGAIPLHTPKPAAELAPSKSQKAKRYRMPAWRTAIEFLACILLKIGLRYGIFLVFFTLFLIATYFYLQIGHSPNDPIEYKRIAYFIRMRDGKLVQVIVSYYLAKKATKEAKSTVKDITRPQ